MTCRTSIAWLAHPVTAAGVAVLLVNDHVLKRLWPGPVTGKLSDLAGMLVAPPLLTLLAWILLEGATGRGVPSPRPLEGGAPDPVERRVAVAAIALTGALFTLMKTTAAGAEAAARMWGVFTPGSRVVADPTDLIALPVLAIALLTWGRAARRPVRTSTARRVRVLVVVPAAVFAVAATSAYPRSPAALSVEVRDAAIIVDIDGPADIKDRRLATTDEGRSWHRWTSPSLNAPMASGCVPGDPRRCYRISPGRLGVEQSTDGGTAWSTAWEISPGRQVWLDRGYDGQDETIKAGRAVSRALVVLTVPGGHVVAVANGTDGVVIRDTSGRWRRLGLTGDQSAFAEEAAAPVSAMGDLIEREMWIALLAAFTVLLVGLALGGAVQASPVAFPVCGALLWLGALMITTSAGTAALFTGPAGFVLLICGAIGVMITWSAAGAKVRGGGLAFASAALVFAAIYLPFLGWSAGWPDAHGTASAAGLWLSAAVLVASAGQAVRSRRRRRAARTGKEREKALSGRKTA
ncbi:hypothetical protein [Microbispora sp. NPDC049125]|uniref:hypothetical protein n=1 Tax=Microbispora sp. NPDC049125 TaxID=3154929 RepID=UPI0034673F3A